MQSKLSHLLIVLDRASCVRRLSDQLREGFAGEVDPVDDLLGVQPARAPGVRPGRQLRVVEKETAESEPRHEGIVAGAVALTARPGPNLGTAPALFLCLDPVQILHTTLTILVC